MPERQFDQRKSFRCSVPESQQKADLHVGRRRFAVRLFNESSGGFAAMADRDPGVAIGDIVFLGIGESRYELRVAHAAPIEITTEDGQGTRTAFRVGFETVRELAALPGGQATPCLFAHRPWHSFLPLGSVTIAASVVLIAALLVGVIVALRNVDSTWVGKLAFWEQGHRRAFVARDEMFAQMVRQLGLSRAQQSQLSDVASQTVDTLQAIDAAWKNDPPEVRLHKQAMLLEAAKAEILRSLSEDQRGRWKALLVE